MAGMNWETEVDQDLKKMDTSTETEHWKKRSIYKVSTIVTELNKNSYRPQAVSFGPYHHGEDHLMPMEVHKRRALLHFLKRSGKPIQVFVKALAEVVQDLKDSYDPLDPKWENDTGRFLRLMILDGCFMLEILRTATHTLYDYAPNDPIFSYHGKLYIIPSIRRDMLMLENQLPMLVLVKLVAVESAEAKDENFVNKLILKFCSPITPFSDMGKCLHLLDVYRKSLLQPLPKICRSRSQRLEDVGGDDIIRSATELNNARIRFKRSKSGSLRDITFHGGVLRLPLIIVDDATESTFLNLMAFERSHVGAGNEVTSYIFFMDTLVDNEKDVALLHSRGIIQNAIGSDKAVAKLFNSLTKDRTIDPESSLDEVHRQLNKYCKNTWNQWNEWRAYLIQTYFKNPWTILSVIAAALLFALTTAQTVYTIIPFYQSPPQPPPPFQPTASQNYNPASPPMASPKPSPRPMASPKPNPHHR